MSLNFLNLKDLSDFCGHSPSENFNLYYYSRLDRAASCPDKISFVYSATIDCANWIKCTPGFYVEL